MTVLLFMFDCHCLNTICFGSSDVGIGTERWTLSLSYFYLQLSVVILVSYDVVIVPNQCHGDATSAGGFECARVIDNTACFRS